MCYRHTKPPLLLLLLVLILPWGCQGAEEKTVKYQLATESVTISKAPSDLSDLKDETLKLIQIDNSAAYGTSNPDYGILAVTMKSSYNTTRKRRSTTTADLFTELTLVNSDLKPVAKLTSEVAAETKSFGCPSSNSSTVSCRE
uniref:Putative secretory peptide-18 n=1 Tax=Pleurobrachia bachei TaxID=34499 RepID=M4H1Q8_PLEBA|nr:putative secretory peptide-18 [Pleurobrachia bachei]|eukprot:sb/3474070/